MVKITESLLKWLQTFDGIESGVTIEQLCDGYLIARVLSLIVPDYFNHDWLVKIKGDLSPDNWRLRISNLKKIQDKIIDWYTDVLNQNISTWISLPDINAIGKECNGEQLGRLLQLLVGIAVQCDKKKEYIGVIMGLEEEVQLGVMQAVQEIMTVGRDRETSMSMAFPDSLNTDQIQILKDQLRKVMEELAVANEARDITDQRCFELEKALSMLREEKEALIQENDKLAQRLSDETGGRGDSGERLDPSDASLKDRHYNKLQHRIETLQEDLYKMEAHREEYRVKNEILEKELMELRLRNEDLQRKANEARNLKDELDVLRHVSGRVEKYEQMIEVFKGRLEEMLELKKQLKSLEDRNGQLVKTNLMLEEEIKRSATLKTQIDLYKKQVQDLHQEVAEQNHRSDKLEFDFKRLEDKCSVIKQEKDKLLQENNRLRLELEETRFRSDSESLLDPIAKNAKCLINEIDRQEQENVEDIREKIIKLEYENSMLKDKLKDSDDEKVILLQANLEVSKERLAELEVENRNLNRSVLELKSQLQDLTVLSNPATATTTVGQSKQSSESLGNHDELPQDLDSALKRIHELESLMRTKDNEMLEMEAKYKKCVNKARQAVRNLEPLSLQAASSSSPGSGMSSVIHSNGPMSAPVPAPPHHPLYFDESPNSPYLSDDVNELKNNLRLKEKQIFDLEKELNNCKALKDMEEKLMTVAFHNLAANVQRRSVAQRFSSRSSSSTSLSADNSSFLNKLRKAQTRRINLPGVAHGELFE